MQTGIEYYPKMLVGVPFTPVAGSRFLTAPGIERKGIIAILGRALVEICRGNELSSIHINFCSPEEMDALKDLDFIPKIGLQFHWRNREYETFNDYLGAFRSERRNKIKRERRELDNQGIHIRALPYGEITRNIQRTLFELYKHHIDRLYYGRQYLNGRFFDELLKRPYPFICPIVAQRDGRIIAGTFNVRGSDALYGRYWGAFEDHRYLHFNVCYYAAIQHCIDESLIRFEAGAGGSFKNLRGLEPAKTYSAHYIRDKRFRNALVRYLQEERSETLARQEYLLDGSPLKKGEEDRGVKPSTAPGHANTDAREPRPRRWKALPPVLEDQLAVLFVDADAAAVLELTEQNLVGQGFLDLVVDEAGHGAGAELGVVAALGEPAPGRGFELDGDLSLVQLGVELRDELVDDLLDDRRAQGVEEDGGVQAVAELRLNIFSMASLPLPTLELWAKPRAAPLISRPPALVVMIRMMLRKSAFLPLLSVRVAWSMTCSSTLNRSGCAFSISSSRSTA